MTSQNRTYYEILGVPEDASFEEIRAAFRDRAREYHPDRNPSPDAVERMQEINEGYEVLRDEDQRAAYDRMHRYFNVSEADFNRASEVAITAVGELAFDLGRSIGARQDNEWTRAGIGDERTPDGLWPTAFEAALEAALDRDQAASPQAAARQAAWAGAQSDAARQARLHTLRERASSPTEAHAIRLAVEIVGMLASAMGLQLGRMRSSERPHPGAWLDAYLAAHEGLLRGLMRHITRVTYLGGVTQAIFDSIVDEAMSSAQSAVRPYAEQMRVGRRWGRSERIGGSGGGLAERAGQGCATVILRLIGALIFGSIIYGVFALAGAVCGSLGSSDPTPVPPATATAVPQQSPSDLSEITPAEIVARANILRVGECVDISTLFITSCSSEVAAKVTFIERYDAYETFPGRATFERLSEANCPLGWVGSFHPVQETWDAGHRLLVCFGFP